MKKGLIKQGLRPVINPPVNDPDSNQLSINPETPGDPSDDKFDRILKKRKEGIIICPRYRIFSEDEDDIRMI
jgi:hypothetical protein